MKVSGFTIVRNAVKFDYPVLEAIGSILPLCDEVIVAVGRSEDNTLELIKSINNPKIKIIETTWDDSLREGGKVLAIETNKALDAVSSDADWCFYIQSDEVIHEKYHASIKQELQAHLNDKNVEGLVFNYLHFYGTYDYVGDSRRWYRREVRAIRNDKSIRSYRDAQGFRKNNRKLNVKASDAFVYHYGWVKAPEQQQAKQQSFHKMWHDDEWMKKNIGEAKEFDYSQIDSLKKFDGTHPALMKERIARSNWDIHYNPNKNKPSFKNKVLMFIEKLSGYRIGEYKNYKVI